MNYIQSQANTKARGTSLLFRDGELLWQLSLLHAEEERYSAERPLNAQAHRDRVYHIVLYISGQGQVLVNEQPIEANRGLLAITSPGEFHSFAPNPPSKLTSYEMTLELTAVGHKAPSPAPSFATLMQVLLGQPFPEREFPVSLDEQQVTSFMTQYQRLLKMLTSDDHMRWCRADLLLGNLLCDLADIVYNDTPLDRQPDPRLASARAHIERHYRDVLTVAALSRLACMSASHFSRCFQKAYNTSPLAYQRQLRMNVACILLQSSAMSIGEIASEVGYPDLFTFSRMFKRHTGMAPRAWRQHAQRIGKPPSKQG